MHYRYVLLGTCALMLLGARVVYAQHEHSDLLVGSDTAGTGNLVVEYPFSERSVVRVTDSGFPGLFTSTDPGFSPAGDDPDVPIFELNLNTEVEIEITAIDGNVSLQMGATPLAAVGDTAIIGTHDVDIGGGADPEDSSLHRHPTFQLLLTPPAPDVFAEGRFSFRLHDTGATYGASEIHTLKLSNGYLPPLEPADAAEATAARKCRKAVATEMRKFVAKKYQLLSACLDKVYAAEELGKSETAAFKACDVTASNSKGLVGKIDAAFEKAIEKIDKACDKTAVNSFGPFDGNNVRTHLGMGGCRAEELAAATHNDAIEEIAEAMSGECAAGTCDGGLKDGASCADDEDCSAEDDVADAFPCLQASQSE